MMSHLPKMDARIARRIAQKKKKLDDYRPLPAFTVQRLHQDFRLMLTYQAQYIRR
jgi:hypothetical protein